MIAFEDVSVVADDIVLLAPVSASVGRGDALVLRGRNGTGKTTLLKVLTGMVPPSQGRVLLGGAPVDQRRPAFRRAVAAMIGLPPFARDLTVRDHLDLIAATWWEPAAARRASERMLDELGLTSLARRFPHELSSGQSQLFGLSLVLARPFEVLVLDEPEQRLDGERVEQVAAVLSERNRAGATLVIATHSTEVERAIGGHALHLESAP